MTKFEKDLIALLPDLRRFAVAQTRSLADGDDLVSTTIVRALEKRDQYRGGCLRAWLFMIARNLWKDEMIARRRRTAIGEKIIVLMGEHPIDDLEAKITFNDVDRILIKLPADWRLLAMLICGFGYSYKETAKMLDIPIGTVMSRLSTIRTLVSNELGQPGQTMVCADATN